MEERIIEPPRFLPPRLGSVLLFSGIWKNASLIVGLTRREVMARHRGTWLGSLWPILEPLMLLGVYTFVFSVVFGARWPGIYESDLLGYAVIVFSGLITFNIFAESVRTCPNLIAANSSFVKRVVFPTEVLPVVQVGAALFNAAVGLLVLLVFIAVSGATLHRSALWVPFVWLGLAIFALGIGYLVAACSVFVRDLGPVVAMAVMALFFGSAIFYPLERLPDDVQTWIRLLPTAAAVDLTRGLLLLGTPPTLDNVVGPGVISFATLSLGHFVFMKTKGKFSDAL